MHKIIFKNSETGIPEDWTQYLSDMSSINRRVESENAGEAGVIVYDNVSIEFEYKTGTPVYDAFNGDLTSVQRYIIEVYGIKTTGEERKVFEGMVDFSSLEWPDLSKKVSFDVLDKLSALNIITAEVTRNSGKLLHDVNSDNSADNISVATGASSSAEHHKWFNLQYLDDTLLRPIIHDNTPEIGSIIQSPYDEESPSLIIFKGKEFSERTDLIARMYFDVITADNTYPKSSGNQKNVINLNYWNSIFNNENILLTEYRASYNMRYQDAGDEINLTIEGGYEVVAFDAIQIIKSIYQKAWANAPVINKTGEATYAIPLNYFSKLIDENPFGKHPLDALKMLADSMQCYIYINTSGDLVIQKKSELATNGTSRTFDDLKKKDGGKKYFWNKLVDEINITVNSWVVDEETGEYLQGIKSVAKNPNIKARNSLNKEILVIKEDVDGGGDAETQEGLNEIALAKATEYFNFYGNRHFAYPIELNLYDDILDWELLDNITIENEKYFFESLNIDLLGMHVDLELVSTEHYPYDPNQAHVIVGEGNEASYSSPSPSSSSNSPGTTVVLNKKLTNLSQMDNNPGLVVQVSDYGFTKRSVVGTDNQVSVANGDGVSGNITISLPQNIHTAASPQFAGTKLTSLTPNRIVSADVDNNLVSTNASVWIAGTNNQVAVADDLDGSVTISLPQDIHTAAVPTFAGAVLNGNVSVDGNLSLSTLTQNRLVSADANNNLVSTNASAWIAGTINQVSVTDDLDGTVTLSLPQNIDVGADVRFAKLGLGGNPLAGYSVSLYGDAIGTNNYVSETTGWKVGFDGSADFRSIYADEMRVKAFTADIEQALAGSDILAKSVAILSEDFEVPDIGNSSTLKVDDLPGFNNLANFVSGDWIRLRIFDRSGGGLTVGDVWGTVSGYISYQDDTQTWNFTTQAVSYPNLIGQSIYMGSIVLDYGTSGQGIIERTVLGEYAPYSQMTTWNTNPYNSSNYTMQLREGNLSGITDSDFGGALSGYGLYATNVYLKGMIYSTLGSDIAGWITQSNYSKSPTIEVASSNIYATTYLNARPEKEGESLKIGLHVGLEDSVGSNNEWISVGSVLDKDGIVEDDKFGIAYKSYNGTYFELTNSARSIAGWNFDTEKFSKAEARLEASTSMSGLVISKLGTDFVRVGDFSYSSLAYSIQNMTDTYIGYDGIDYFNDVAAYPSYSDDTKWNSGAWIASSDVGFNGDYNTLSIYGHLDGQTHQITTSGRDRLYWWSYTLQRKFSGREGVNPLSKLMGHRSRINYKLNFDDSNYNWETDGGELSVFIRYYNSSDVLVQHIFLENIIIPDTPVESTYVVDRTGSNSDEIDFPYNADADYAVLFFQFSGGGQQGSVEFNPLAMTIQDFSVYGYDLYYTALNREGLEIYNSPINYFKFGEDKAEIYATDLKVAGLRPTRFHGVLASSPTNNVQVGDIFINNETTYICYALDITGLAKWKQISAQTTSGAYGIDDLSNTAIGAPSLGQVLKYDGANWVNSSATGGAGSGDDADLLDGQHGNYYLDWNNTSNKPSPIITLDGDATGAITLSELTGGTLTVAVVNDSHTHSTQYSALGHNHDATYSLSSHNHNADYSLFGHNHDDRYFTEIEITANYYDKNYIDTNFTTTTNQYSKWTLTDGNTSFDVLKDNSVSVDGTDGITININPTTKYLTIGILGNTYAPYSHNHHDLYFTEAEITTNYYDKTYIDANFTTSTNLYTKWILTDGTASREVVKDDTITFSGSNGVTTSLVAATITLGIAANTYSAYGHNHDAEYLGINDMAATAARWANSITFTFGEDVTGSVMFDGSSNATVNITVLDDSHIHDGRYFTETESDAKYMGAAGGTFTGNVTVGSGTDTADRYLKVITGDNNIASIYAVGNSFGHGNVFVGENMNFGGGMFFKGSNTINEPRTVHAVSFYRKNYTSEAEVFYYNVHTEGVHFNEEIYAKGITSSVITGTAPFTIASTTLVTNLNADLWDGYQFADYLNQGVRTSDNVTFGTISSGAITSSDFVKSASIEPTNLTTGYLPYKSATSLVDSPICTDGTNVGIGVVPSVLLHTKLSTASGEIARFETSGGRGLKINIWGGANFNPLVAGDNFYFGRDVTLGNFIVETGNLLVGTSTDNGTDKFQVNGSSYLGGNTTFGGYVRHLNSSPNHYFATTSATHYNWRISAQETVDRGFEIASGTQTDGTNATTDTYTNRFVIKADTGYVGIGRTPTSYLLEVQGDIYSAGWLRTVLGWRNQVYGGGMYMDNASWIKNYGSKPLYVVGNGTTAIQTWDGSVDVRSNTTSTLNVFAESDNAYLVLDSGRDGLGVEESGVFFKDNSVDKWVLRKTVSNNFELYEQTASDYPFVVFSNSNIHLDYSGTSSRNVIVGGSTDNGAYKFQVNGSSHFSGNLHLPDETYLYIGTGNDFSLRHDGGASMLYSSAELYIGTLNAHDMNFRLGGVDRWVISSSGTLYPKLTDTYGIGSTTRYVNSIYAKDYYSSNTVGSQTFTSGILGVGWRADQTHLEVVNLTVRNALRTHIFQKDVVNVLNGYQFISDSGVVVSATSSTVTFRGDKSATFANDTEMWIKGANSSTGIITSIKFTINSTEATGGSGVDAYRRYNVTFTEGSYSDIEAGMIGARTSGGTILLDASSTYSPFIDFSDGTSVRARFGNLEGKTSPTFGTLNSYGGWIDNLYAEGNVNIAGTLTAGDANGVGNTFYAGKINKNLTPDSYLGYSVKYGITSETLDSVQTPFGLVDLYSLSCDENYEDPYATNQPQQYGNRLNIRIDSDLTTKYTMSFWLYLPSDGFQYLLGKTQSFLAVANNQDNDYYTKSSLIETNIVLYDTTKLDTWQRVSVTFSSSASYYKSFGRYYLPLEHFKNGNSLDGVYKFYVMNSQAELGSLVTPYQPTDGILSTDTGYGMWVTAGGAGGTMQNPVVAFSSSGLSVRNAGTQGSMTGGTYVGNYTYTSGNNVLLNSSGFYGYVGSSTPVFYVDNTGAKLADFTISTNKISSTNFEIVSGANPYIGIGTSVYGSDSGIWLGEDNSTYKMSMIGTHGKVYWTGSQFIIKDVNENDILRTSTTGATIGGYWEVDGVNGILQSSDQNIILSGQHKYISINSSAWATSGIQLQYNNGVPRAYIGNGSDRYFNFDGTNISWDAGSSSLSTAGHFTTVSADIGGWNVDDGQLYRTDYTANMYISAKNTDFANIPDNSLYLGRVNNSYNGLVFREGGSNYIQLGMTDLSNAFIKAQYSGNTLLYLQTGGESHIASWSFDHQKFYSGTDIILDAFNKRITLSNGAMGFGYDIGGANKHGLFINANNFWYSNEEFRLGGTGGVDFDGTYVTIGSDTRILGTVTGGDMVVAADGSVQSANYVPGEEGWKLNGEGGFENNEMRQFELLEDIDAGTPVKLVYDGVDTKVAKLKESNLELLNDNEIYNDAWEDEISLTLQGTYTFTSDSYYVLKLNDYQFVVMDTTMGTNEFSILVVTFDSSGKLESAVETVIPRPAYDWASVTYYLNSYSTLLTRTSDSTCFIHFRTSFELNGGMEKHYAAKFGQINIASDGAATLTNVSNAVHDYSTDGSLPSTTDAYKLNYASSYRESFSLTNILFGTYLVQQSGSTYTITEQASVPSGLNYIRTTDGKLMGNHISSFTSDFNVHLLSVSGTTVSDTTTALGRTDFQYVRHIAKMDANKYAFTFKKTSDNATGVFIVFYNSSTGVVTVGNDVGDFGTGQQEVRVFSPEIIMINGYMIKVIANLASVLYKAIGFSDNDDILIAGTQPVEYEFTTSFKTKYPNMIKTISTYPIEIPSYIKNSTNKVLRFARGNLGTASDFARLNSEKYALVRHESFASTNYLMFTIVERLDDQYVFYANDLIVANANVGTYSKIQKISDSHFLVKNGAYIFLIKLVGTTLSLVDTHYDTAINSYNQGFAELTKGSLYVFMGSSKAVILSIIGDNLVATSYSTTTSTLISNFVGINDTQWVGAYSFNSGGYKATYRTYTFTGSAVTYTDLINTTLVDSTENILLAPIRGNVILSIAILSTGNGVISIEELYSTSASTQDSREYASTLFPSIDKLERLNSDGYGGVLGDNIVHITITGGKINTRFATNIVDSNNVIDSKSITAASNGDMLLYVKGDFVEDNSSGGQDAIVIDIVNDSFYVDGIMEQTGLAGETKKVAMAGDETRVFSNLVPGTRYGLSFDYPEEVVEDYDKELILAVETNKALVLSI